jgi:hypothetical protein
VSTKVEILDTNNTMLASMATRTLARPLRRVAAWQSLLPSQGFAGVAFDILTSVEYRGIVVTSYYDNLLHRQPPTSDVAGWANGGTPLLGIRDLFEVGTEFYSNG